MASVDNNAFRHEKNGCRQHFLPHGVIGPEWVNLVILNFSDDIGSGNGLLPDGINPQTEPVLTRNMYERNNLLIENIEASMC